MSRIFPAPDSVVDSLSILSLSEAIWAGTVSPSPFIFSLLSFRLIIVAKSVSVFALLSSYFAIRLYPRLNQHVSPNST